jgi:PKD repeat protein
MNRKLSLIVILLLISSIFTTAAAYHTTTLSNTNIFSLNTTTLTEQTIYELDLNHNNELIYQSSQPLAFQSPVPLNYNPGEYPPIWETYTGTGQIAAIIVWIEANPRINEMPIQPGDWLGGFYLDDNGVRRCGGAVMWPFDFGGYNGVLLPLIGNDPATPEKDGFIFGEPFQLRIFSSTTQKDYIITNINYTSQGLNSGTWSHLGFHYTDNLQAVVDMDFYITASENPLCVNTMVSLTATEFIGTTGSYSYSWSSDPPGFNYNIKSPPPILLQQSTVFYLDVTDGVYSSHHHITVIVHQHPTAIAGEDIIMCETDSAQLQGLATNYSQILWTTSGDGSFSNPAVLNPMYTPGSLDKEQGTVILTLHAISLSACSVVATDTMNLLLSPLPGVFAGDDIQVCSNEPAYLNAEAFHYSTVQWITSGSGTFSDPTSLTTQYYPSTNDVTNGMVTVTVIAQSVSPCSTPSSDSTIISFIPNPTVYSTNIQRKCQDQSFSINGGANSYSSLLWTTPGDGYFEDPYGYFPGIYHPGPNDIANGGVTITITAFGIGPCSIPATKEVQLIIYKIAVVDAGGTMTMSPDDTYIQLAGSATNSVYNIWSNSGDGYFSNKYNLDAKYYPGSLDRAAGEFTLILSAYSHHYCSNLIVSDELYVTIIDEPLPPTISLQPIFNHSTLENQPYSYQVLFDEVESTEPVLFSLLEKPTGMSIDLSTGLIQWLPGFNDRGVHMVTVEAMYINFPEVSDSVSYELTVFYEIINPTADFSYIPESPLVDEIIQFTDLSMDPDGAVVSWSWDFGDGSSSTQQNPSHIFDSEGIYMVSLTVTDDDGATDTIAKEIIVQKDDSQSIVVQYNLSKGVNFISFDFLPDSLYLEDIFAPLTASNDLLMIIADNAIGGYYLPAWNINTLGNNGQIELYRGYKVVMNKDAILNVSGTPCTENIVLDLVVGANFVSFSNETVVLDIVGDLFDNDSLSMIIDLSCTQGSPVFLKKLWNNDFLGSLELFQPGHIYLFIIYDAFSLIVN